MLRLNEALLQTEKIKNTIRQMSLLRLAGDVLDAQISLKIISHKFMLYGTNLLRLCLYSNQVHYGLLPAHVASQCIIFSDIILQNIMVFDHQTIWNYT
jgi:hypothetical protein